MQAPPSSEAFEHYAGDRSQRGPPAPGARSGAAGGAPCGDLVRLSLRLEAGRIERASFAAEGCAAARAAVAAIAALVEGESVLDAARIGPGAVAEELGGLSSGAGHAAELAADALHRALGAALAAGDNLVPPSASGGGAEAGSLRRAGDPPGTPLRAELGIRPRVLVAMSGGVDSAVAALLEREAGAELVAVTLKLWADRRNDGERSCCSPEAVLRARALAHSMGIAHLTMDLTTEFRSGVVDPFLAAHRDGLTPNPCVLCNGGVRIDAMVALAKRLGGVGLATGHYARIADDGEGPLLVAALDTEKDQTYMLSALDPGTLASMRFPLAGLRKPEVRGLAERAGLPVAGRTESQDLCFLAGEGKRGFLARHGGLSDRAGEIVDRDGGALGQHSGHHNFTVGQRRGIGIGSGEPLYVLRTEPERNRIVVGAREELRTRRVELRDAVLHRGGERVDRVRLRYRSPALRARLRGSQGAPSPGAHGALTIELAETADCAAPGQTACLMDGDAVVGHATIV